MAPACDGMRHALGKHDDRFPGQKGAATMAHIVCEPCHDCKYTDCVLVCPMDCFFQDEHMLYIDPDSCIDCEACVSECPVDAIFQEEDVPAPWRHYVQLN